MGFHPLFFFSKNSFLVKNPKIVIVGCGIVGALMAYELSHQFPQADVVVLERSQPAQGSTGAALGVLMGVISGRVKGRTWRLREASIRRYHTLMPELAAQGHPVPYNQQGIVSLCCDEAKLPRWETLKEKRHAQGWPLEIWSPEQLKDRCPHVELLTPTKNSPDTAQLVEAQSVKAAIYSPADRQVQPVPLTRTLIEIAQARGVSFHWEHEVTELLMQGTLCTGVQTSRGTFDADWLILTAGLGSAALSKFSNEPLALIPVLGQAMEIQLPAPLGNPTFQPVINGHDIQCVPLGEGRYWIGATVEFPPKPSSLEPSSSELSSPAPSSPAPWTTNSDTFKAQADGLANLRQGAESFISAFAQATVLKTWSGLRPRPVGQPAPVIKPLGHTKNVTLATGHYRNGVLLAPATAQQVCKQLSETLFSTVS